MLAIAWPMSEGFSSVEVATRLGLKTTFVQSLLHETVCEMLDLSARAARSTRLEHAATRGLM
jgi:hypothetical protein